MKTRNKIIRSFSTLLTFIILAAMAVPFTVNAENKVYNIDSASFTLTLEEDGSAVVYEQWTLNFIEGSFTRFFKDICSPPNQLEYIAPDNITVLECKINDIPAELNTGERVDGHYFIDYSNENPTINWYQSASQETVTYTILYRINNAVKLNEDDKAMISYRFIGDSFSKPVDRANILVNLPNADKTAICRINQGETMVSDDKTIIMNLAQNVSGIYKAELTMDASIFSGLGRIIDVNVPESIERAPIEPNDYRSDKIISFSFIPVLMFIAAFAAIFGKIFKSGAVKTIKSLINYKKDPEYFKKISDQLEYYGLPYTFYLMPPFVKKARNYPSKLMAVEILDLCRQGRLKLEDEGIRIYDAQGYGQTDMGTAQCDTDFISFMREVFNGPNCKSFDSNFISYDNFTIALDEKNSIRSIYRKLMNWKKNYKKAMKKNADFNSAYRDKNFRKLKNDLIGWAVSAKNITPSSDPYDCFSLMKKQERLSLYTILELICSDKTNSASASSDDNALIGFSSVFSHSAFAQYYIAREIYVEPNNSSSGSSCSSCSSCGGCGGGGGCGGCGGGGAD